MYIGKNVKRLKILAIYGLAECKLYNYFKLFNGE